MVSAQHCLPHLTPSIHLISSLEETDLKWVTKGRVERKDDACGVRSASRSAATEPKQHNSASVMYVNQRKIDELNILLASSFHLYLV